MYDYVAALEVGGEGCHRRGVAARDDEDLGYLPVLALAAGGEDLAAAVLADLFPQALRGLGREALGCVHEAATIVPPRPRLTSEPWLAGPADQGSLVFPMR